MCRQLAFTIESREKYINLIYIGKGDLFTSENKDCNSVDLLYFSNLTSFMTLSTGRNNKLKGVAVEKAMNPGRRFFFSLGFAAQ